MISLIDITDLTDSIDASRDKALDEDSLPSSSQVCFELAWLRTKQGYYNMTNVFLVPPKYDNHTFASRRKTFFAGFT
jgi:hypothetical protein